MRHRISHRVRDQHNSEVAVICVSGFDEFFKGWKQKSNEVAITNGLEIKERD